MVHTTFIRQAPTSNRVLVTTGGALIIFFNWTKLFISISGKLKE